MTDSDNKTQLAELMDSNGINADVLAAAISRSRWTIYQWRTQNGAQCPQHMIELIKLKIANGDFAAQALV